MKKINFTNSLLLLYSFLFFYQVGVSITRYKQVNVQPHLRGNPFLFEIQKTIPFSSIQTSMISINNIKIDKKLFKKFSNTLRKGETVQSVLADYIKLRTIQYQK